HARVNALRFVGRFDQIGSKRADQHRSPQPLGAEFSDVSGSLTGARSGFAIGTGWLCDYATRTRATRFTRIKGVLPEPFYFKVGVWTQLNRQSWYEFLSTPTKSSRIKQ